MRPYFARSGALSPPVMLRTRGWIGEQWKPSITLATVLSVIQEKVNNPSADDPFEPEIAAVSDQI
jgi:ubiquitin-protein ligase